MKTAMIKTNEYPVVMASSVNEKVRQEKSDCHHKNR